MQFYSDDYHAIQELLSRDTNRDDAFAVRRACHELSRLVMWRRTMRLKMVEDGLLVAMAPIIELHVEQNPDVVVDFCRFLRRCISLKEPTELDIQSKVTEAGFLNIFRRALEWHPDNRGVFQEICKCVALLCFDMPSAPHADNQIEIAESGLLQSISDSLRQNSIPADNAEIACEALLAIIYENETTSNQAVEECGVLQSLSELLSRLPSSKHVVQSITQTLFQIKTLSADVDEELIELQFVERTLDFLESNRDKCDALLLWHVLKFFEIAVRHHEPTKDEFCRCHGPSVVIQAIQHARAAAARTPQLLGCLYFVSCMLFSRLAVDAAESATAVSPNWPVVKPRIDQLMQSTAHQFALQIMKTVGSEPPQVAEEAVRLLELVATIETNRIPLTRLGASRQVKVIYNSTSHRGLLLLCERAIAAIEGT